MTLPKFRVPVQNLNFEIYVAIEDVNQDGVVVMTMKAVNFLLRRPASEEVAP